MKTNTLTPSAAKHTPGPWTVRPAIAHPPTLHVIGPNGGCIASANQANARLIAAAPDLLAVVQRLARYCEQHSVPEIQGIACDAFNAIAKAEGRA